jgi:hypothetical protein
MESRQKLYQIVSIVKLDTREHELEHHRPACPIYEARGDKMASGNKKHKTLKDNRWTDDEYASIQAAIARPSYLK